MTIEALTTYLVTGVVRLTPAPGVTSKASIAICAPDAERARDAWSLAVTGLGLEATEKPEAFHPLICTHSCHWLKAAFSPQWVFRSRLVLEAEKLGELRSVMVSRILGITAPAAREWLREISRPPSSRREVTIERIVRFARALDTTAVSMISEVVPPA